MAQLRNRMVQALIGVCVVLLARSAEAQISKLSGSVRNSAEANLRIEAAIQIVDQSDTSKVALRFSDKNGAFLFESQGGEFRLTIRAIGYDPLDTLVRISGDSTTQFLFRLHATTTNQLAVTPRRLIKSQHFNLSEPNYFLFGPEKLDRDVKNPANVYANQIKFRVSVRYRLVSFYTSSEDAESGLYFGYRQNSYWNLWEDSAPFYDNNYNPQAFLYFDNRDYQNHDMNIALKLIVEHESNGRDGLESRSWNRYGGGVDIGDWKTSPFYGGIRVWKTFGVDQLNADIVRYAGRGEATLNFQPRVRKGAPLASLGLSTIVRYSSAGIANAEINGYIGAGAFSDTRAGQKPRRLNFSLVGQCFLGTGETLLAQRERHQVCRLGFATIR